MTNKMGVGTYRASGMYEDCFIRDRLLEMVLVIDLSRHSLRPFHGKLNGLFGIGIGFVFAAAI